MSESSEKMSETTSLIMGMIYLLVFILLVNYFAQFFINSWYYLRLTQLTMVSFIPDWIYLGRILPFEGGLELLTKAKNTDVNGIFIRKFDAFFAPYMSWIPALFIYHLFLKLNGRNRGVTDKFSMEAILERNSKIFPFLRPYVNFNPATMVDLEFERDDLKKLQYLPALNPVEFSTMIPPLGLEKEAEKKEAFRLPIWDGEEDIDEDLAKRAFEAQMGDIFSPEGEPLTPPQLKIFNLLRNKMSIDRTVVNKMVKEYCEEIINGAGKYKNPEKLSRSRREIIKELENLFASLVKSKGEAFAIKKFTTPKEIRAMGYIKEFEAIYSRIRAEDIMLSHGFVVTGLMTMLEEARGGGVVPCVEFIELKGEDRKLWYALQCVGRKTAFVEAAGPYAHWLLEKMIGKAITQPEVTSAVEALKLALFVDKKSLQQKKKKKERMGALI